MNHFTIVLPSGHQCFTTSGRYIEGENLRTSARTAEAARLAVFTIAGEADAAIVRGMRWAASMIFYMLTASKPTPAAPAIAIAYERPLFLGDGATTVAQRMQAQMCAEEGVTDYRAAWQAKMDRWLAAHPDPKCKPPLEPRRFAQPTTLAA